MRQKTTITLIVAAVSALAALIASLTSNHNMTTWPQGDVAKPIAKVITAETITSAEEFDNAVSHERLILHFDVDWAIQAIQSRPVIVKFKETIAMDVQYRDVEFRRVDCTEQEGPVWDAFEKWLREQNADQSLMFTGYGAIAWVKSGKVVDAVHYAAHEGVENMVARTRLAMSASPQGL